MGKDIDLNAHIIQSNTEESGLDLERGDQEQVPVISHCVMCACPFSEHVIAVVCSY